MVTVGFDMYNWYISLFVQVSFETESIFLKARRLLNHVISKTIQIISEKYIIPSVSLNKYIVF